MDYSSEFLNAFERVIGHEGKYQREYKDRGNWTSGIVGRGELKGTKFGISAMSYPELDIEHLSLDQARAIYYQDFWLKIGGRQRHAVMYQLFDAAINHGTSRAVQFLQRAVGSNDDGHYGPKTQAALLEADPNDVLLCFLAERLDFMNNLSAWATFSRGWSQRIAENLRYAALDN